MSWWHYLLLVNFYLVLFFGFYVLLLRRETFFQLNRIYLVGASLLSFFIPLMQADWVKSLFITQKIQSTIYSSPIMGYTITFVPEQDVLTVGEILNALYIGVTLFLLLRLCWQLLVLKKAIEKPEPSAAYSFFKKISMGKDAMKHDVITAHELVHAKQWHSVDVMIVETVMIINWFNPVVYFYRFAIKYIHEYIADRQVIQAGTDKAEYAMLLLSQTFDVETHTLATPFFNRSLLKQRIMMLQKNKSQRIALAKYGLSAPLFALMLIFSSATVSNSKVVTVINNKAEAVMERPAAKAVAIIADKVEEPIAAAEKLISPTLLEELMPEVPGAPVDTTPIMSKVDKAPTFEGGMSKFYQYISSAVRYPKVDKEANVQGKAFVNFVVEKDGTLSNIKGLRGPSQTILDEAVRVLQGSPRWTPGSVKGEPVRVQYTIPIAFTLSTPAATTTPDGSKVDEQPSYPGGMGAFYSFLGKNLRYPAKMKESNIEGNVYVSFMVEADGSLTNIKALREPGEFGAGEEAVRVMKLSPKWDPGKKDGQPVKVEFTLPIKFSLSDAGNAPASGNALDPVNIRSYKGGILIDGKGDPSTLRSFIPRAKATTTSKEGNAVTVNGYGAHTGRAENVVAIKTLPRMSPTSPLYIIDGKLLDLKDGAPSPLSAIPQENIASMEILKDETATKLYGDKGKYGVILVTTKEGAKAGGQKPSYTITTRTDTSINLSTANPPLILIDGVAKTKADLNAIPQENIVSIDILKDEHAIKPYGDKGKYGVVKVTTKNAKK